MRSIRVGDYIGEGIYEVYVGGDICEWSETYLRFHIKHCILDDMYCNYNYYNNNNNDRYRISRFLTVLVILGVGI